MDKLPLRFTTYPGKQVNVKIHCKNEGRITIPSFCQLRVKEQSESLSLQNDFLDNEVLPNETFEFSLKFEAPEMGVHWAVFQIYDSTGEPIGEEMNMEFCVVE